MSEVLHFKVEEALVREKVIFTNMSLQVIAHFRRTLCHQSWRFIRGRSLPKTSISLFVQSVFYLLL